MTIMTSDRLEQLAENLRNAENTRKGTAPITSLEPALSVRDAYQIQLSNIHRKLDQGQRVTGKKIGLTSLAMQKLLGVDQPDYGHLLNGMTYRDGSDIPFTRLLQPKVEAEIAFVLKRDLVGPNVMPLDVLLATDHIVPSLEIVDSRIQDWKITLADTVADNASSGLYLLGEEYFGVDLDLENLGVALYKNGELMNTGVGSAALGHPAIAVAWLANKLFEFGISLKAGEVILSGALSAAIAAEPGDRFEARFAHIGTVRCHFTDK